MKKIMKVLCFVLVMMLVIAPVTSLASEPSFESIASSASGSNIGNLDQTAQNIGGGVYTVIRTIAYVVAICMIAYMAIQWFLATPAKKAELKGRMWSMAIGVLLLVAGVAILEKVGEIGEDIVDQM